MNTIKLTLSEKEASEALGCSVSTYQVLARQGKVPAIRFGDAGYVSPIRAFEEFLYEQAMANLKDPPEPAQTPTQKLHEILIGPGKVPSFGGAVGYACGGEVKPKGPPRLVPLMEPPGVGAAPGTAQGFLAPLD